MPRPVPGIVIAGTSSGVGKTTVATGIVGALRERGFAVQPFKAGPDYIDPSYLSRVCDRPCRNLDSWMVPREALIELYARATAGADVAVVEGVMGLFDGHAGREGAGGSAHVAKLLGLPVILVMDVGKLAQSAAAVAFGYAKLDPELHVVGVIANNDGGAGHLRLVEDAVRDATGLPVVGHLPRRRDLVLAERHLGLVPVAEGRTRDGFFADVVCQARESIDLDAVLRLAAQASPPTPAPSGLFPALPRESVATIAVARDEAFCFYYQDNLDLLEAWGARLVPFSPLDDEALPAGAQGLYVGGGFPELFAARLAANERMLAAVRRAHADGMPIYAECGGLMYLCESVADPDGNRQRLAGLVPTAAVMQGSRLALAYAEVRALRDTPVLAAGETARGHEFHWSSLERPLEAATAPYDLGGGRREGFQSGSLLASYVHLHFASNPRLAANFVAACAAYGGGR